MSLRTRVLICSALVLGFGLPTTGGASAAAPRVPADYYAADFNFSYYKFGDVQSQLELVLGKLAAEGIDEVRGTFSWAELEPNPPGANGHRYVFDNFDRWVTAAAKKGIRIQANFAYAPDWASDSASQCQLFNAHSPRPTDLSSWRLAAGAFSRRYGRGGTFWSQHPSLPQRPIKSYEIWNEQNLHWYWCPAPQPEVYSTFLDAATQAIRAHDPQAELVVGGMTLTSGRNPSTATEPGEFLRRAFNATPRLRQTIDSVGIHPYAFGDRGHAIEGLRLFREEMRAGTMPDSMPMKVTEIGWPLRGTPAFPEEERAQRFRLATTQFPRTNCNVGGLGAYTWISDELRPTVFDDWFGLAAPSTGDVYPSGQAFGWGARLMRGELAADPPRDAIMACAGMPKPDQDRDGVPDQSDDFPLDPSRTGDGNPPPGGGDPPPGGGDPPPSDCQSLMAKLRLRIAQLKAKKAVYKPYALRGHVGSRRAVRRIANRLQQKRARLRRLKLSCPVS